MKRAQYRQGDVLLVRVEGVPEHARRERTTRRLFLAEGEVTGHAHVLEAPELEEVTTGTGERFLRVLGAGGLLTHEEHATLTIPPGEYEVRRQREYRPQAAPRVVSD